MTVITSLLVLAYLGISYYGIKDLTRFNKETEYYRHVPTYDPNLPAFGFVWLMITLVGLLIILT